MLQLCRFYYRHKGFWWYFARFLHRDGIKILLNNKFVFHACSVVCYIQRGRFFVCCYCCCCCCCSDNNLIKMMRSFHCVWLCVFIIGFKKWFKKKSLSLARRFSNRNDIFMSFATPDDKLVSAGMDCHHAKFHISHIKFYCSRTKSQR